MKNLAAATKEPALGQVVKGTGQPAPPTQPRQPPRLRPVAVFITSAFHLGCLPAFFAISWHNLAVFSATWLVSGLGITFGWHRLLTHASFRTFNFIKYFSTLCGCLAIQGSPFEWVGIHRLHHRDTDSAQDPHSPAHSLLWAHFGWSMVRIPQYDEARRCIADLKADPIMVWIDQWWFLPQFLLAGVLFWVGGWQWLVWGVCVRTVVLWHCTWMVNSVAHRWGYRNFATSDSSTNNWFVALISLGEGWHNNHHAQQRSAAHGMMWWEMDLTYSVIALLRRMHLVWQVIEPEQTKIRIFSKL